MTNRMHASIATLAIAAAGLGSAHAAETQPETQQSPESYFFSQAYYVVQDNERAIYDDDGLGFRLGFGRQIAEGWHWEGNLAYNLLENGIGGYTDYYQLHAGIDLTYRFGRADGARPFVLLGIGAVRDDVYPLGGRPSEDETSFFSNVGFGITSPELFDIGLKLRADARYVISEFAEGYEDGHFNLGFEIPLGRKTETRTVVQVKEVIREVPVANADSDQDGVIDGVDRCPNTLRGAKIDQFGCAQKAQTVKLEGVTFKSGSAELTGDSVETLTDISSFLINQPELRLEIAGHTDSVGNAVLNRQLSQKRADAVKYFLVRSGVDADRMRAVGYGESDPVASNSTPNGRAKNRRVEFRIQK